MATTSTYTLLQRTTLNADTASVVFSSIPQTGYTDLKLVVTARESGFTGGWGNLAVKFNNDSNGYYEKLLYAADGSSGAAAASANSSVNAFRYFFCCRPDSTADTFSTSEMYIPNYTSSVVKSVSYDSCTPNNSTTAYIVAMCAGYWNNTAAISSITISSYNAANLVAGSTFSLYAISATGTTPGTPKALGGDIIRTDGTYWYHAFLNTGTFAPFAALSCDYLVVAGGGGSNPGGGAYGMGGGGAGGYRTATSQSLSATNYPVLVGAGGARALVYNENGSPGASSTFNSFTSAGGGYGASALQTGGSGGSGGGGSTNTSGGTGNTPSTSPSQGNNGGAGSTPQNYCGGGGGGAGATGSAPASSAGGVGGGGSYTAISGGSTTALGQLSGGNYYFAGGGGGGGTNYQSGGTTGGAGGIGGGGAGGTATATTSGAAYNGMPSTGGGGGGGAHYSDSALAQGGNGGSGIVIIRYAV